tara:strand:+ start:594 stop:911 length:318 start_codon:yes stop_codon:yes gene_type:complete
MGANKIQNLILVLSLGTFFLSCDNKVNIPYSRCECYENYYDIKKGKYDDYALRGNFMRKNNLRKNMENKTDEVVQFTYLDSVDREIRRQCIKKYGKEVEQFGECD